MLLRARYSAITFDLGAAGIRALQVERRGGLLRCTDALQVERATPAANEDPSTRPAPDPAQLQRLLGQGSFRGRDVALVLSCPDVQFFPTRLPPQALRQSPARIEQALKWEVAQETRQAADELEVRFWPLPAGRGQQTNVMAVVMPAALAGSWCELLDQAGLHLRRIDAAPCALVRLAGALAAPESSELWGVLDLGLRQATLTVVLGRVPIYIRTLSVSSLQWTQRLAAALEVTSTVAEQLKRQHGVQPGDRGLRVAGPPGALLSAGDLPSAFGSILREDLQTLAREVDRCFSYVLQSFPDSAVRQLLLAGGGAALRGLPALLEAHLGVPVQPLDGAVAGPGTVAATLRVEPRSAAALGGAILDLEARGRPARPAEASIA